MNAADGKIHCMLAYCFAENTDGWPARLASIPQVAVHLPVLCRRVELMFFCPPIGITIWSKEKLPKVFDKALLV